jgi:hypothetical protein
MNPPKTRPTRMRHPTLWTVEAVRWEYRKEGAEGPVVQLGESLDAMEVPDRGLAVAIAHYLLDKHAEQAVGRTSLEVHVHPAEQDVEDETQYEVTDEVLEQARQLGIEGDVERQVKRMASRATPYTHERANLQYGGFALRIWSNKVTWLGRVDPPPGRRRKGR